MGFMGGLARAFSPKATARPVGPQAGGVAPVQNLQGLGAPAGQVSGQMGAMPNPAMQQGMPPPQMHPAVMAHLQGLGPSPQVMAGVNAGMRPHGMIPQAAPPAPMLQAPPQPLNPPPVIPPPVQQAPQPSAMNPLNLPNPLKPPTSGKQLGKQLAQPFKNPVKTAKKIFMPWK